jgi:hypothetical protein
VGAELFCAEGLTDKRPTDMTKLIVVFHNFVNAPKKEAWLGEVYENVRFSAKERKRGY